MSNFEKNEDIMGNNITEQEIQKHKDNLYNLIYKLKNIHNVYQEKTINNKIKNEVESLSFLFNIKENKLNESENNIFNPILIKVFFYVSDPNIEGSYRVMVQCNPEDKVSSLIEKYRIKSGDKDPNKKFIFNAKSLNESLTIIEAKIMHNACIFVVTPKKNENDSCMIN